VIAPTDLLEKEVTLVVVLEDGTERPIHGLVRSLASLGPEKNFHAYRLHVVPRLWLLTLSRNCRIFQEKDVKDIVGEVLGDISHRFDCTGAFPKREFTVQYRETDFAFVSRLLEEEGIFYFFEHSDSGHKLVLANHQGAIEDSPAQGVVKFQDPGDRVYSEGIVDHVASES
jgi:type VI secretion system secreted protein VgrG